MKRVMCVYLPQWPLQRLEHDEPELRGTSLALAGPGTAQGQAQVVLCCARAERSGVRRGMPLPEALTVDRSLHVREQNPDADALALGRLATWLERFSPFVAVEDDPAPQALLLDITGCADYFHGEECLLQRAVDEFAAEGWAARVAIADTMGAAWGLARYGRTPCLAPAGETERALQKLPAAALRLPAEALELLARLHIDRIGSLLKLPREDIPSRFGPRVLERLDQALGRLPEVLTPYRKPPEVQTFYRFEYPTDRRDVLEQVLREMVRRTEAVLQERNWGARRVECWLYHGSAPPTRIEFGLCRPSNSAGHLWTLLRASWEQTPVADLVQMAQLRVPVVEPVSGRQDEFFESGSADAEQLCGLIDRLSLRLGYEAVTRVSFVPDPQPEYACLFEPLLSGGAEKSTAKRGAPVPLSAASLRVFVHRPLRLLPKPARVEVMSLVPDGPPVKFRWAGADYQVKRAAGPERIETGWWRGADVRRDYYIVTTQLGTRFWLFRRRDDSCWFLHGCFD